MILLILSFLGIELDSTSSTTSFVASPWSEYVRACPYFSGSMVVLFSSVNKFEANIVGIQIWQ